MLSKHADIIAREIAGDCIVTFKRDHQCLKYPPHQYVVYAQHYNAAQNRAIGKRMRAQYFHTQDHAMIYFMNLCYERVSKYTK